MKNTLFALLTFFLMTSGLTAQISWCNPNAQWHFDHNPFWRVPSYKTIQYTGDVTLAGLTWNKLHLQRYGQAPNGEFLYTHLSNQVVYLYTTGTAVPLQDTLYWFAAKPGDTWRWAPTNMTKCSGKVIVTDTGHRVIQGQNLKWLSVQYKNNTNNTYADTIFERLGAAEMFPYFKDNICNHNMDSNEGGKLRCFSDNQINNYKHDSYPKPCDYDLYTVVISTLPESETEDVCLHPNPASDYIIISSLTIVKSVTLTDISGRVVVHYTFGVQEQSFSLPANLENGVYYLLIHSENNIITKKLVVSR